MPIEMKTIMYSFSSLDACMIRDKFVLFATVVFSQSSSCFEGIPRLLAEGWLNCSNLEVIDNFKVSCSATEEA